MTDYGHELLFGTLLTPTNARPEQAVELAQLSEEVGLDLATFQDHPYQPAYLDTWTLMSFVAARTSRIRLSANVTNLPLRPPAVLARSLASLDLLSGGRVELGLGAGAFWEAIEAMGGRRLTPGQGVRALEEAIEVIKQVWDARARGGVRVDGEHYRLVGAKRGPAPAHDIAIWLGAYKPKMLALTGRAADGWLPSLGYLQPGDLAAGNRVIDASAQEAGRSPRDIRRLLNVNGSFLPSGRGPLQGPAEQWAEELADFALSDGTSVFILASDEPDDLRRFAAEVAPTVRELVQGERSGGGTSARTESAGEPPAAASSAREGPRSAPAVGRTPFAVVPTPDDGQRRSDVRAWDESTRPSRPPADPGRTYTAHEQATGRHLVDVHDGLRAELAQVQDLIVQVAAGTLDVGTARSHINTMTMRQNKWVLGTYCESYCRIVTTHHTLEDRAMFPQLRSADPRLTPVIDRLEHEHTVINDVLEGVDRALVEFVAVPDGMGELRAAVDLLSDTLLSRLSYEERELVEPLARLGTF
jgi:alkanesulfonate monooxygenase SsuD/methylene tetrahydromethanopterin reductase-like flavin-dependent oxidoreductase (luciferase family)